MHIDGWISDVAVRTPEKTAIQHGSERLTYLQLAHLVDRLTWLLSSHYELAPGDRIAHLALNNPVFLALVFACARTGVILTPFNYRLAQTELSYLINDTNPRLIFVERSFQQSLIGNADLPGSCRFVGIDGSIDPAVCDDLPEQLDEADLVSAPVTQRDANEPLLIVHTSGTTGTPKGVVLSQAAIHWNSQNSQHMHAFTAADQVLVVLPFFHVGGINIQTLPALQHGATVTLMPTFDPAEALGIIAERGVTLSVMVPTQMQGIAAEPEWGATDLSSLRAITTGSTMVSTDLLQCWEEQGVRTLQVYGCTESCPIAICQSIVDSEAPPGSVGKVAKHGAARVVDESNNPVADGIHGEIELQGPNLMSGYWKRPDETAASLRNGWLATGDLGYRDSTGHFFIVDRLKHMIISGGENIYPAEIERLLQAHPDVKEVAVVGIPDEKWGEMVSAAIVPVAGRQLDDTAILDYLEGRIAHFKLPRRIEFGTDLPRNAMGKVDIGELRAKLGATR